jgi:hypothetical protein
MSDDRHCEKRSDEAINASGAALDCFAFRLAACSQ